MVIYEGDPLAPKISRKFAWLPVCLSTSKPGIERWVWLELFWQVNVKVARSSRGSWFTYNYQYRFEAQRRYEVALRGRELALAGV